MRKRILPKGKMKIPNRRYICDKNGKCDIVKYIVAFDRVNKLVPGGTFVKGMRV